MWADGLGWQGLGFLVSGVGLRVKWLGSLVHNLPGFWGSAFNEGLSYWARLSKVAIRDTGVPRS